MLQGRNLVIKLTTGL